MTTYIVYRKRLVEERIVIEGACSPEEADVMANQESDPDEYTTVNEETVMDRIVDEAGHVYRWNHKQGRYTQ